MLVGNRYSMTKMLSLMSRAATLLILLTFLLAFNIAQGWSSSPESEGAISNCWSEADLKGNATDIKIVAAPAVDSGVPPARLRPNTIGVEVPSQMRNSIRRVNLPSDKKLVALTFDLCEREKEISGYDHRIVNYLRANGIKATFFASGKWMRSHPEKTMQLMADPLFEIGNHGWSHRNIRMLDRKRAEEEIVWTQAQYELLWEELQKRPYVHLRGNDSIKQVPKVPLVFRFPFGACNLEALGILRDLGLPAIQWDVVSGDAAKSRTARGITETVMKQAKSGSILIFHANGRGHGTAESLPMFIPKLWKEGFGFVTVSELLSLGTPVAVPECYELKPRDNLRYDKLFAR